MDIKATGPLTVKPSTWSLESYVAKTKVSSEPAKRHSSRRSLHDTSSQLLSKLFSNKSQSRKATTIRTAVQWLASLGPEGPGFDRRIVPQLIDQIAAKRPHAIWASIPLTMDPRDGFREVTYREFARAIDRAVIWLEKAIGKGTKGEKIAYLSGSQISSLMVTLAASKLDCQILFLSPRNSLEGQISLIDQIGCRFLATPKIQLPQTESVLRERPSMEHIISPELADFLDGPIAPRRPFVGTFEQVRHKVFIYVHSSGTTSLPKPVGWTHGANAGYLHELTASYPEGQHVLQNATAASAKMYLSFPLFHLAGLLFPVIQGPMCGTEIVLPPQGAPLSAELSNKMYTSVKAPFTVLEPPMITEEVVKDPVYFKNLLKQQLVMTGSAALPKSIGDKIIAHGVPVRNMVAASETGMPPLLVPKPETEWHAFAFAQDQGLEFEDMGDGRYELVYRKLADGRRIQAVFENHPWLDVYRTNDMFAKHPDPDKPDLWVLAGRSDDVIVLLNGEKFTPTALEDEIQGQPGVKGALVFGMQREQASLLIEPAEKELLSSPEACQNFIDKIWPAVEIANSKVAAHGRILQTHILLTRSDKPMLRTSKGSIQRSKTFELYASEIEELYLRHSLDAESDATVAVRTDVTGTSMLELKVRICSLIGIETSRLGDDDNIFATGFDSLHAMQLTRAMQKSLGSHNFDQVVIYNNPTVRQLSSAINNHLSLQFKRTVPDDNKPDLAYDSSSIATLLLSVSKTLPSSPVDPDSRVAILTGSSGGLGSHLLEQLRASYTHIYCLLRHPPATAHKDLPNITYLHADLSAPSLGLTESQYTILLRDSTHIIHNAWLVDFNQSLPFFAKNIDGVRGLINFAATARRNPRIFFVSSVGAVSTIPPDTTTATGAAGISETVHLLNENDRGNASRDSISATGYSQSKRVAELLLAEASRTCGVRVAICRIGQIAGTSVSGMKTTESQLLPSWQKRDWVPRLLASAKAMGALPEDLGAVGQLDWMPIDHVAQVILDLLEAGDGADGKTEMCQVWHVANPALGAVNWGDLLPVIRKVLGNGDVQSIRVVSPDYWVGLLEGTMRGATAEKDEASKSTGAPLLRFYKDSLSGKTSLPSLSTVETAKVSKTLRSEPPMNVKWMEQWLSEWFGDAED